MIKGKCRICGKSGNSDNILTKHKKCIETAQKNALKEHLKCLDCYQKQITCKKCTINLKGVGLL